MYEKEYKKILKNKKYFEHILDLVNSNKISDDIKLQIAKYACKFATLCPTGYFYSNTLEKYFVDIAQILLRYDNVSHSGKRRLVCALDFLRCL